MVMNESKENVDYIQAFDSGFRDSRRELTDLPNDLFLIIISHLSSRDAVRCRRVSRAWLAAFTADDVSWNLMRWHFPRAREVRTAADSPKRPDWTAVFAHVARRYHHLREAKPREIEKIEVAQEADEDHLQRGVEPWMRVLQWQDTTDTFQYRDPTWCLDDGLLIYQEPSGRFVAYDLERRHRLTVPFDGSDKVVRRTRLACGVLVFEWCEREPYHQLNERTTVHRHFATAFDVHRSSSRSSSRSAKFSIVRSTSDSSAWTITFRSEWKIHFLGLPMTDHDRFFSTHSSTHYALYLWQPNRSPWGEEDPLEQITVWDIAFPSAYRPSEDPTGGHKPDADLGPAVIQRLTWRDLDFFGLRQRHNPSLRGLFLDEGNVYVHEEDHRWIAGPHSSLTPPRHHLVRCTSIPFTGYGPRWFDECCADGDVHLAFCPRSGSAARLSGIGPGSGDKFAWPGLAPCWRHEEFPYLTVSEMVDATAGVRIVAKQCFMVEALSEFVLPRISIEVGDTAEARFADEMWAELMGKGLIIGDERWVVGEDVEGRITILRF